MNNKFDIQQLPIKLAVLFVYMLLQSKELVYTMLTHYTSLQQTMSESYASLYIDSICSANFFTTANRFSFRVGPNSPPGTEKSDSSR